MRDSVFRGIHCESGAGAPIAIHFWKTSRDTVVERNVIEDCARGSASGLGDGGPDRDYPDAPSQDVTGGVGHLGGVVRNNVIRSASGRRLDTGIGLEQALGARVYHNTVYADAGFSSIDTRFPNSTPHVANNLLTLPMTVRDGARPTLEQNLETAAAGFFVDPAGGDLRLAATADEAIGRGADLRPHVPDDFEGDPRKPAPDLGADERQP